MAYTKHEWECGETITAEKLNNIENGVQDALDCCGGSAGYECKTTPLSDEPFFTGDITTTTEEGVTYAIGEVEVETAPASFPNAILATINGIEHALPLVEKYDTSASYGASWDDSTEEYDFSEYPCCIEISNYVWIATPTAGTYDITITMAEMSVSTTNCFEKAVRKLSSPQPLYLGETPISDGMEINATAIEIYSAIMTDNRIVMVKSDDNEYCEQIISCGILRSCNGTQYIFVLISSDGNIRRYIADSEYASPAWHTNG